MTESNSGVVRNLSLLYRICDAGEKGFATAATSIHNPAIKVLFKSFAQQRANFKQELLDEIEHLGRTAHKRSSLRGIIHRGSFSIFVGMTIGEENQEKVCLRETARGESIAVSTYNHVLAMDLPERTRALAVKQFDQVRGVSEQVDLLRGKGGNKMLARLFENEKDAMQAIYALQNADVPSIRTEKLSLMMPLIYTRARAQPRVKLLQQAVFSAR
jgi:uncharacterized protein (TIGR02284 family)